MNARIKFPLLRRRIPLEVVDPRVDEVEPEVAHLGLRVSPLERRLLAEFVLPNSAHAVARSAYWKQAFREPVRAVLGRLKAHGLLVEPDDPRARICQNRDESDLRVLCLEHGLLPLGRAQELADRLLTIDPSGWLLGYSGELLQCSEFAARSVATQSKSPASVPSPESAQGRVENDSSGNEDIWEMLRSQVVQTARDGNLALCRNVHVAMANHLLRRNKQGRALQALCIVCVFDLCGARNRSDAPEDIRESYSRFDTALASLAPWLVKRVSTLSRDMGFSVEQTREFFLEVTARLKIPTDRARLWAVLQRGLEGSLNADDEILRNRAIQNILSAQ
jgi:hypothetical protein